MLNLGKGMHSENALVMHKGYKYCRPVVIKLDNRESEGEVRKKEYLH